MKCSLFNIDRTVQIEVDYDGSRVFQIYTENGIKNLKDVLDSNRYSRVVSAVEFLIKEKGAVSATTSCGVAVGRGRIPK